MSIGRRMAMKALMGAPFVAKAAATEAASQELMGVEPSNAGVGLSPPMSNVETCPITDLFYKKFYEEEERRGVVIHHRIPSYIAEKKSWSTSFKESAARDDWQKNKPPEGLEGRLKWLVDRGILPKDCL